MKKVESLRQLQLISIYIYRDLLSYCEKNGLRVYLHSGSLLGAVRHKGFIPWDDDIDVCMSRPDYETLVKLSGGRISEKCSVIDPKTDDSFNGCVPLVVYNESQLNSKQFRTHEKLKISISIFDNPVFQKFYYAHMYILRAKLALCRADFRYVNTRAAKIVGPIMQRFYRIEDIQKRKQKILKYQEKYPYAVSKKVSTNADYRASREVRKMQKLNSNILSTWPDNLMERKVIES